MYNCCLRKPAESASSCYSWPMSVIPCCFGEKGIRRHEEQMRVGKRKQAAGHRLHFKESMGKLQVPADGEASTFITHQALA